MRTLPGHGVYAPAANKARHRLAGTTGPNGLLFIRICSKLRTRAPHVVNERPTARATCTEAGAAAVIAALAAATAEAR